MADLSSAAAEPYVRTVEAAINYVAPGSFINRRFVAPGVEHNTGQYEAHPVLIRDGRALCDRFTLDVQGFVLARRPSRVTDFFDKEQVERIYPDEVLGTVRELTGAKSVVPFGWMIRTAGDVSRHQRQTAGYAHRGGVQPPAGEAHVDFTPIRATTVAQRVYEQTFPDGHGYSRFIASSLWRTFSPPPQDFPLALCDARTVGSHEGIPNTMFVVDQLPDPKAMLADMPEESSALAAAIFHFNANHRWWYFSNMSAEEILLFKFHDSDPSKAMRTPHTAFHDPSFPESRTRESIEFRTIAFFD